VVLSPPFYFMLSTQIAKTYTAQDLAKGFNVGIRNIQQHTDKLTENLDFILSQSTSVGGKPRKDYTEQGVIKLANIIQTNEAKEFVKQVTLQTSLTDPTNPLFWQKLQQQNQIALDYLQKALEKKEKENQQLALTNTELATRDLEVKTEKEYKWKVKVVKDDLGKMINYYVRKHFLPLANNSYSLAHTKAKKEYKAISGVDLPAHISLASTEAKREYLNWLSKI